MEQADISVRKHLLSIICLAKNYQQQELTLDIKNINISTHLLLRLTEEFSLESKIEQQLKSCGDHQQ